MGIYQFTFAFYKHGEVANCIVYILCFAVTGKDISFYSIDIYFGVEYYWEYSEDRSIGEGVRAEI